MKMTTINYYPTFNYSQPEEYKFSHDSVFLARKVYEILKKDSFVVDTALDLCAGCGIVGLDFLFHSYQEKNSKQISVFDFVEVQNIYNKHFEKNKESFEKNFTSTTQLTISLINYSELANQSQNHEKYDLIISNPPYFQTNQGKLSQSNFKNRCRFFIDSDFANLISAIEYCLKPKGRAFVLLADNSAHGIGPIDLFSKHPTKLSLIQHGLIRKAHLVEFHKL